MNDDKPPSLSTMDAALVEVESSSTLIEAELLTAESANPKEGEIEEQKIGMSPSRSVVVYSSSPPPLIEDPAGNLEEQDGTELAEVSRQLRGKCSFKPLHGS